MQSLIEKTTTAVASSLEGMEQAIRNAFDANKFYRNLPDIEEALARFGKGYLGAAIIDEGGYRFALKLLTFDYVTEFAEVSKLPPQIRGAAVTNRLLAITRSDNFKRTLLENFASSSILVRRKHIIEVVLSAHLERNYELAIPALLAQVEGALGDLLTIQGSVVPKGPKLYIRGEDGKPELDTRNKPKEVRGLSNLVDRSKFKDRADFNGLVDYLTEVLVPGRNSILHGRNVRYGGAKLSCQGLFVLLLLFQVIVALENGEIEL